MVDEADGEREAFHLWLKQTGWFLDWSRLGDGYEKPAVDRAWHCWQSAVSWARHNELLEGPYEPSKGARRSDAP